MHPETEKIHKNMPYLTMTEKSEATINPGSAASYNIESYWLKGTHALMLSMEILQQFVLLQTRPLTWHAITSIKALKVIDW